MPHRVRTFKLSKDPAFVAKLRDVVGLYMSPPAHSLVLSVDEKSQIQALDRTQPGLPMKEGRPATMTHDYIRHGTTTLFAALNVLDGTVLGRCMQRHRHQEFIRFLNAVEAAVPAGKLIHAILDNYAAHKHPKVRAWLARHPRWTFHFTPTSCSWLNAVEAFFADPDPAPPAARRLPLAGRPPGRDQPLPRRAQQRPQALRLDRRARPHHREGQPRVPSVSVSPLAAGDLPPAVVEYLQDISPIRESTIRSQALARRRARSWIEARWTMVAAEARVASKSLANLRLRPSQAKVLATSQRLGRTAKPRVPGSRLTIWSRRRSCAAAQAAVSP